MYKYTPCKDEDSSQMLPTISRLNENKSLGKANVHLTTPSDLRSRTASSKMTQSEKSSKMTQSEESLIKIVEKTSVPQLIQLPNAKLLEYIPTEHETEGTSDTGTNEYAYFNIRC
jgi:hypothetical protein